MEIFKIPYLLYKHSLSTTILRLTGSCPNNAIVSDVSGDISIPKYLCHVLYCGGGVGGVHGTNNLHNRKVDYWFLRLHFFMYC